MHQLIPFNAVGRRGPLYATSHVVAGSPWWTPPGGDVADDMARRNAPRSVRPPSARAPQATGTILSREARTIGPDRGHSRGETPQMRYEYAVDAADGPDEDVCSYLFGLCKRLDDDYLQPRGITFMFDVSGGGLDGERCRTTGLLIAALVLHTVSRVPEGVQPNGVITISLHRNGDAWSGSISDSGIAGPSGCGVGLDQGEAGQPPCHAAGQAARMPPPPAIVARLAAELNARLDHVETGDGTRTVFEFGSMDWTPSVISDS